jgi:hypothetical protein
MNALSVTRCPPYSWPSRIGPTAKDSWSKRNTTWLNFSTADVGEDCRDGLALAVAEAERVEIARHPPSGRHQNAPKERAFSRSAMIPE